MEQKFYVTKDQIHTSSGTTQINNESLGKAFETQGEAITKYLSETFSAVKREDISVSPNGVVTVKNEDFTNSIEEAMNKGVNVPGNLICGLGC